MGTVKFALLSWFSIVRDVWRQQFSVLSKKTNNISVVSSHFHLYLRISALRLPTVYFSQWLSRNTITKFYQTWYIHIYMFEKKSHNFDQEPTYNACALGCMVVYSTTIEASNKQLDKSNVRSRLIPEYIDWLIYWLMDGWIDWSIDWSIDWLINCLMDWWIDWTSLFSSSLTMYNIK